MPAKTPATMEGILARLERARAELEERIVIERQHGRDVAMLADFVDKHPLLTKSDVRKVAAAMKPEAERRQGIDLDRLVDGRGKSRPPPPADLGLKLRAARENKGLSVDQLASRIKITPTQVERWESGRIPGGPRDRGVRERLVKALGLSHQVFAAPGAARSH